MRVFYRVLGFVVVFLLLLVIVYLLGPKAETPQFSKNFKAIPTTFDSIESYVSNKELSLKTIKPDNEARIVWNDSIPARTQYSIVYLHGFGASQGEGEPVHKNVAKSINANLYLARLARHGLEDQEAFVGISPEEYMASAYEAIEIGRVIGEKVIIMATSTGATQALYLASKFPKNIVALVLYSPFIELADANLQALSVGPWHDEITDFTMGTEVIYTERPDSVSAYWSSYYHADAYKALFTMVKYSTGDEVLNNLSMPVYVAYYYKNEEAQDDVVSVKAIKEVISKIPAKRANAFSEAGDHVIASKWRSFDWRSVQDSTLQFLTQNLEINN